MLHAQPTHPLPTTSSPRSSFLWPLLLPVPPLQHPSHQRVRITRSLGHLTPSPTPPFFLRSRAPSPTPPPRIRPTHTTLHPSITLNPPLPPLPHDLTPQVGCGGNTAAAHLAGTAIDEPAPPPPIVTQVRCARVSSLLGMCYRECVVVVRRWSTASSIVPLTLSSSSSSSSWVYGTRSSRLRRSVHGMARVCAVCRRVCMAATLPVDST